jgi:hypothetical protein
MGAMERLERQVVFGALSPRRVVFYPALIIGFAGPVKSKDRRKECTDNLESQGSSVVLCF